VAEGTLAKVLLYARNPFWTPDPLAFADTAVAAKDRVMACKTWRLFKTFPAATPHLSGQQV
jgi:hypothetical protein